MPRLIQHDQFGFGKEGEVGVTLENQSVFKVINLERFPFEIKNKNKMPTYTTSTQNHNESARKISAIRKNK